METVRHYNVLRIASQMHSIDVCHLVTKDDQKFILTLRNLQEKLENKLVSSNSKKLHQLINPTKHCLKYLSEEAQKSCIQTKRNDTYETH